MRTVIQRVNRAEICINHTKKKSMNQGLVVLAGIEEGDTDEDLRWLSNKIVQLRIFSDQDSKMNLSLLDIKGEIMVISQFTLHASTKRGNRPSWIKAAAPEQAKPMFERFVTLIQEKVKSDVIEGEFGAHMDIELVNDGPVTIWIDTKQKD